MRCPRCETSVDDAAVRCNRCGAPLQLLDEPPPAALDVRLDLDRRRPRATPAPARAVEPVADDPAAEDDRDLGDLSFDPPADDSSWSFGRSASRTAAEPLDDGAALDDGGSLQAGADDPAARAGDDAEPAIAQEMESPEPAEPATLAPTAPAVSVASPAWDRPGAGDDEPPVTGRGPELADDEIEDDADELDAAAGPAELGAARDAPRVGDAAQVTDEFAARRGRMLSLASLAVAGAIALMALLTSR